MHDVFFLSRTASSRQVGRASKKRNRADRPMLGSDYCFDTGYERPVEVVTALKLSRSDQKKILGGNAMRLFRLS
ncbi:MAG: amidohydrolase family protein [Chloroflexi bacterium]|nr:amidohydrolase family protein [Chloroflexota bacterium]